MEIEKEISLIDFLQWGHCFFWPKQEINIIQTCELEKKCVKTEMTSVGGLWKTFKWFKTSQNGGGKAKIWSKNFHLSFRFWSSPASQESWVRGNTVKKLLQSERRPPGTLDSRNISKRTPNSENNFKKKIQ